MPQAYDTIEKLFYKDASAERFSRAERIARERLEAESTFRTGIELESGELFLAVPRALSVAHEQVLRRERRVSALWRGLPRVALGTYVRSLIADEVVYSNEIEGVRSTRRQIKDALDAALAHDSVHAPFVEFARLYLGLTDAGAVFPAKLEEIRSIYDSVVGGTVSAEDQLGDELFRTDEVYLYNERGQRIHTGAAPERIRPLLRQMLALARADIPEVFCAALCHFVFEYVHPFYDGNGRTGRYLLALQLSEVLSQPTALSLSRVIAQNKAAYYKAFDAVERPLNHAEATPFALMLCDLLLMAQDELIADLEDKRTKIDAVRAAIGTEEGDWTDRERDVLFFAAQRHLFDLYREIRTDEVADYLGASPAVARAALKGLEARGLLRRVGSRPLAYVLADAGVSAVGWKN